jgi:hypothetical protein
LCLGATTVHGQVIISANVGWEGVGDGTLLSSVNTYRSYSQQGRQESPSPLIVTIGATAWAGNYISDNVGWEGGSDGILLSSVKNYRSYSQQGRQDHPHH